MISSNMFKDFLKTSSKLIEQEVENEFCCCSSNW